MKNQNQKLIFARVFTVEDAKKILDTTVPTYSPTLSPTLSPWPAPTCLLIDVPPTIGSLELCTGLIERGWIVIIKDHHYPETNTPRDQEIKQLSDQIGRVSGQPPGYRSKRADHPGCSTLFEIGGGERFDLIIADKDPDGLLSAMKAIGEYYNFLDSDCALLDGQPQCRNKDNMTELGWDLNCCWQALTPRDAKNPTRYEQEVDELFKLFRAAARFEGMTTNSRSRLSIRAQEFEEMTKNAQLAVKDYAVHVAKNWWLVDLTKIDGKVDRGGMTRLLEGKGAEVIVSKLNFGVIAERHGGVQYSAARTSIGEKNGVNLMEFKPVDMESGPDSGVISNFPPLLHMSSSVWWGKVSERLGLEVDVRLV